MLSLSVYMDNHATTRVDPRVLEAMLPFFSENYGNAGSVNHTFGSEAKDAVQRSRKSIAKMIGARPSEIVFTSGATESNNLALRGVATRYEKKGRHLISLTTEHKAILDPLDRLTRREYEVTLLPVKENGHSDSGLLDIQLLADAIRDDTILVSVMLANNEIGVIQPLAEIAQLCKQREVILHCDATQAVGRIPVDVAELGVDLMSFSAHKCYGPKGVGALFTRRRRPFVRIEPQIDGGSQEGGLRSGTLNVPGIVGFAQALEICAAEMPNESTRLMTLRNRIYEKLTTTLNHVTLNGPALDDPALRLSGNLNLCFTNVDGEALLMSIKDLALSSGSACTSANPEPSHVLRALGLSDDETRSSLRFGLGRFNTEEEADFAADTLVEAVTRLRKINNLE